VKLILTSSTTQLPKLVIEHFVSKRIKSILYICGLTYIATNRYGFFTNLKHSMTRIWKAVVSEVFWVLKHSRYKIYTRLSRTVSIFRFRLTEIQRNLQLSDAFSGPNIPPSWILKLLFCGKENGDKEKKIIFGCAAEVSNFLHENRGYKLSVRLSAYFLSKRI